MAESRTEDVEAPTLSRRNEVLVRRPLGVDLADAVQSGGMPRTAAGRHGDDPRDDEDRQRNDDVGRRNGASDEVRMLARELLR
jgi:hypothetical protein